MAVEDGATEIDIVINRTLALTGHWAGVYFCFVHCHLQILAYLLDFFLYPNTFQLAIPLGIMSHFLLYGNLTDQKNCI